MPRWGGTDGTANAAPVQLRERAREHVEDYGSPLSRPSGAKRLVMHIADALHVARQSSTSRLLPSR